MDRLERELIRLKASTNSEKKKQFNFRDRLQKHSSRLDYLLIGLVSGRKIRGVIVAIDGDYITVLDNNYRQNIVSGSKIELIRLLDY